MPASFKLSMQLGASLGSSVRTAFQGTQGHITRLGSSIDKLRSQQQSIQRFSIDSTKVNTAQASLLKARKTLAGLRAELNQSSPPTKQFTQNLDRAQRNVDRLSAKLAVQQSRLETARRSLKSAGLSTRNLSKDNERLGRSIATLNTRYQSLSRAQYNQARRIAQRSELRGQVFDSVAVGAAVAAPITVAINFEEALSKLEAIVGDPDSKEDLKNLARTLGQETQFSASQAVEAMTFLGMAGFDTAKILGTTAGVLDLAQASGEDLARTADIASNILSGFSLEASDMGRVGDALTATFTGTNTTLASLGETMKFVAPVAASVGASIEDVAAMTGLLGDSGIQGSKAGTALRATFLRLSAPVGGAATLLSDLGVELTDLGGNLRPVPILLKDIAQATQALGSAERAAITKGIFGEEAASGVTKLLEAAVNDRLAPAIDKLHDSQNTASRVAKTMADNTRGSLRLLGSALESVAISLGTTLLPALTSVATIFARVAGGVSKLSERFPILTQVVVGATASLIALRVIVLGSMFTYSVLAGAVGSLGVAYSLFSTVLSFAKVHLAAFGVVSSATAIKVGIVTAAQWAWNVAMLANPIGLIVVGIGALIGAGVLLVKHWDKVTAFFSGFWQGFKSMTAKGVNWVLGYINLLLKPVTLLAKVGGVMFEKLFGEDSVDESLASATKGPRLSSKAAAVGSVLSASSALALPPPTQALPDVPAATTVQQHQRVQIDAPISIQATPDMDEQKIALEVRRALDERDARARQSLRGALFDIDE